MKRKIVSAVLILCMLAAFVPCIASAETYGDFEYERNDLGITITAYTGNGGDVVIPDKIDNLPVTSIGDSAFMNCKKLTKITLPQNLTYIGNDAFYECSAWEGELVIPDGVASISSGAFMNCEKLTKITLPQNLTYIGDDAFCQCYAWEGELVIPDGVTNIGNSAFKNCFALEGELIIPNGVMSIGDDAFYECEKLTKITLPQNLTYIGDDAFCQCRAWEGKLTIPEGVTTIGKEAFKTCEKLTKITLPQNVTSIGEDAFYQCLNLAQISLASDNAFFTLQDGVLFNKDKTVLIKYPEGKNSRETYTVPDGVKELSIHALANCYYIPEIILPESLETIGKEAFEDCDKLTEITIPAGVTTIYSNPFFFCDNLKEILVDESNQNFCGENGVLFDKNKTRLIQYLSGKDNVEYSVPDTVSEISEYAFCYCKYLEHVNIPDSVTNIGISAFQSCKKCSCTVRKQATENKR